MISKPILLGSTGLALLLSGVAFAMPQVPIIPLDVKPGQTYVTVDAQYSGVPEDDFKFHKTCPFDDEPTGTMFQGKGSHHCDDEDKTPFLDASHSIDAYGGGGIIGVAGSNPWFGGEGQRFELGFGIIGGDRNDSRSELFDRRVDELTTFDGKTTQPCDDVPSLESRCGRPRHIGLEAHAKTDYDAYNIVARTLIDYELSPSFTITPNFGFVFRHTENTVHAIASWIDEDNYPDSNPNLMSTRGFYKRLPEIDDRVRTTELGVELGTTLSFNVSDAFKLFGGVNGEFLYREGRLNRLSNGRHSMGGGGGCAGGGLVGLSSPSPCTESLVEPVRPRRHDSDSESDTAVNVTLSLGALYRFSGGTTISVIGYAQNESHLVAVNQSHSNNQGPPALSSSNDYRRESVRLESERDWTPGVVVALTIPFGGT